MANSSQPSGMPDVPKFTTDFMVVDPLTTASSDEAVQDVLKGRGVVPVLVVGHSLGGALATLCAAELIYTYNLTDVQLYTFGSLALETQLLPRR